MRSTSWLLCAFGLIFVLSCGGGGGGGDGSGDGGGGGSGIDAGYARVDGGTSNDDAVAVAPLPGGACIVAGSFAASATFGAGEAGQTVLVSAGITDIYVARYEADGSLAWAKRAGGTGIDRGAGVATLADGSCIVVGSFRDVATFGPGETNQTLLDDIDGEGDAFIARYEADGSLAWAKKAGRNFSDHASAVAAFSDGSCVVTGAFTTIAIFGAGEPGMVTLNGVGSTDAFVARYNADGTLAWAKRAGGTDQDVSESVAAYADGSCVIAGYFGLAATFAPGEPEQQVLTSAGILDAFVARYTASGSLMWARRAGGASYDEVYGVATTSDDSCVVTGFFRGESTFGPGQPAETILTSFDATNDIFVARYDAGGSLQWAIAAGGGDHDGGRAIAAYADGSSVVTGRYQDIAVFGRGETGETFHIAEGADDAFVACFEPDGSLRWARTAGGNESDYGFGVAIHDDGTIATCGRFWETIRFSPDEVWGVVLDGEGALDAFLARYNPDGSL